MFTLLGDPLWSKVIGSVLILFGLSFIYKSYLALPDFLTFDAKTGYRAPGLSRAGVASGKLFGQKMDLDPSKKYYDENPASYEQSK